MKRFPALFSNFRKFRFLLLKQICFFACLVLLSSYWEIFEKLTVKEGSYFNTSESTVASNLRLRTLMFPFSSQVFCPPILNSPNILNTSFPYISSLERILIQKFILDYSEFHITGRSQTHSKFLIFRPHQTGLGDQFERLITAYYVAVVTRRILLIDWNRPFQIEDLWTSAHPSLNLYFRSFDQLQLKEISSEQTIDRGIHNKADYIDRLLSHEKVLLITTSSRPPRSTLEDLGTIRFGIRGSLRWTAFLGNFICRRALMHHVLQVSSLMKHEFIAVAFKLNLWSSNHKPLSTIPPTEINKKYISVHARFGAGVGEKHDPRFRLALTSIEHPLRCLAKRAVQIKKLRGLSTPIFFATDTPKARNLFTEFVKELTTYDHRVVHGDWEAFHSNHIDRGRGVKNGKLLSIQERRTAMWGIYMDLMILGYSEHIISLKSSFPRLAFSMGTAKSITEIHFDNCSNY